jgi:hypothetical protein
MVTTTTYANWKTGDIVNICASITEFCGTTVQSIYANDINVTESPNACNLQYGAQGSCGLHLNNVELTFKLVGFAGSVQSKTCAPQQVYKNLGGVRTNSNGVAALTYTVTDQDRLDYGSASGSGYQYVVMACITNSDGQSTISGQTSIVTYPITIVQNLCHDVTCPDICAGGNLYYQTCDPTDGQCIQGTLKEANSIICTATHYIEWDFGLLDSGFLDFILSNITSLSNWLGTHLPTPPNIVYKKAEYVNGKFRIYVKYTVPTNNYLYSAELYDYSLKLYSPENEVMKLRNNASSFNRLHDTSTSKVYNIDGDINSLSPGWFDWISSGINLPLDTFARIISAVILFMIAGQFGAEFGLWVGIVIGVIAAIVSAYMIYDLIFGTNTTGITDATTPIQRVTIVQEFVDNYVDPAADTLKPQCTCSPTIMPTTTCTVSDMLFYLGARATARYAQCLQAHANEGDATTLCGTVKTTIDSITNNLTNGTITIQQACTQLENNVVTVVKNDVKTVIQKIDCATNIGPGWTWDTKTQKCIQTCNVPAFGQCMDTPLLMCGLLLGGYVIYHIFKKT